MDDKQKKDYYKQYWIDNKKKITPKMKEYFKEYWSRNKEHINLIRREKYKLKKLIKKLG